MVSECQQFSPVLLRTVLWAAWRPFPWFSRCVVKHRKAISVRGVQERTVPSFTAIQLQQLSRGQPIILPWCVHALNSKNPKNAQNCESPNAWPNPNSNLTQTPTIFLKDHNVPCIPMQAWLKPAFTSKNLRGRWLPMKVRERNINNMRPNTRQKSCQQLWDWQVCLSKMNKLTVKEPNIFWKGRTLIDLKHKMRINLHLE